MSVMGILSSIGIFLWELFKSWVMAFAASFTSMETIWIIVPIWLSWFFAEFFQEKKGTSFGNAISNGVVPFWVGIDWIRHLTNLLLDSKIKFSWLVLGKYSLSILVIAYGLFIIIYGIKTKSIVRFLGRIREVTYVLALFTPFIYGLIQPSWQYFLSALLFFPIFYFAIELIDRYTPEPKGLAEDLKEESASKEEPSFDSLDKI